MWLHDADCKQLLPCYFMKSHGILPNDSLITFTIFWTEVWLMNNENFFKAGFSTAGWRNISSLSSGFSSLLWSILDELFLCRIIAFVDIVAFVGRPTDSIRTEPESSSPSIRKSGLELLIFSGLATLPLPQNVEVTLTMYHHKRYRALSSKKIYWLLLDFVNDLYDGPVGCF